MPGYGGGYPMQSVAPGVVSAPGASYGGARGSTYEGGSGVMYGGSTYPIYSAKAQYEMRHSRKPINTTGSVDFKQAFLHTLITEIRLNQVIHSDKPFVVVQADLESFGPSLIHGAALTALEYFGVPEQWLEFFKKFLQPKVCFAKGEELKTIVRGVPTSHALSSLFGETLLFLLDFLINQRCNGMRIYRIADEFWFWNDVSENVTKAWETMLTYGKMVGLKIKENRSGSVSVYSDEMLSKLNKTTESTTCGPAPLPQNNIHWGYLKLHSNGTFIIDQKAITKFLKEMQDLLDKSECVLEWINIFNKYLEFFIRNFGKCALVSGKQHLDQIISSLRIIYVGLFGSEDGNPVEKLKVKFDKLKSADIVDVWAYWPLERGGLGLINPYIGIMSLREAYVDINDEDLFTKLPLEDKDLYDELKKDHERRYGVVSQNISYPVGSYPGPGYPSEGHTSVGYSGTGYPTVVYPGVPVVLPTWEEYLLKRETELGHWYFRYLRLLERPGPKTPTVSERFWRLDAPIPQEEQDKNYMMWLFTYYETQLVLHFGSVKFINTKLLPMSMISNIQKTKVQH